ncbi:ABC transporter substrate-binding protein [Evansella cellulosilytica]|uniref:Extracellular solute-binding protein family 1 n=1 Tax=Evansella cellulosilytica (strain ATCC 21833 / DSM 2522 / FERM P-1141 / JCM 9156 / N-4) TaxID=649639 RepID=E6TT38_EVAC2|nr:extracellular solute-binding protein [Evansella cellulosilytica]ADU31946.1 extracellular solute-binding protein family 1 [Evansella cellulosilytica DSM 2522]
MNSFKVTLRLVFMALVLLLLITACGQDDEVDSNADNDGTTETDDGDGDSDDSDDSGDEAAAQDPVELKVVTTMAGTDPAGEVFEAVLEEYMEANPHVTFVNESQSADAGTIRTKINTDFTSNNEPDIMFYFNTIDAHGIIENGLVVDLEEAEGIDLSGYNEMLEQQRHTDGNIYAAPQTGFYEALFVNTRLFEEHGIELPTTWELYEEAIEKFAETDVIPVAVSTEDSYYVVEHYVLAAGGIENYRAELADENAAWAEGLDMIAKHAEMGAFPVDAATIDLGMATNLFREEKAAMLFEGSWAWGGHPEEIAEDIAVLPMPVYGDGGQTGDLVGGSSQGWFISTKAYEDDSKRDTVVDFFNFITSEEILLRIAGATGQIPAKGQLTDLPDHIAAGHALVANATAVEMPINDRILPEAFTHIRTSVPSVVNGSKTGAEVIAEAAAME